VVTGANDATLDGFIVADGDAGGAHGGGMFNIGVSPSVANCVFVQNIADNRGGAVYSENSSLSFTGCVFAGNISNEGGAVQNRANSTPTFSSCVFSGNTGGRGGAIYLRDNVAATFENVIFAGNFVADRAGGLYSEGNCSTDVTNAVFTGNVGDNGGGVQYRGGGDNTFVNCTFTGNWSNNNGGAIQYRDAATNVTVTNSILWNDIPAELFDDNGGVMTITYSDFFGGYTGAGNVDVDPGFVGDVLDSGTWLTVTYVAGDYKTELHDSSASWTPGELDGLFVLPKTGEYVRLWIVNNTSDTIYLWGDMTSFVGGGDSYEIYDLHLDTGSGCIDIANGDAAPALDIDGNPRVDDPATAGIGIGSPAYTDMGTFEYQP
jgi:predicted outer membrane repeat protein